MRRFILSLFVGVLLSAHSAMGITVIVDTALSDEDTLVFDVIWGSSLTSRRADPITLPNTSILAEDDGYQVRIYANASFQDGFENTVLFASEGDRLFANATILGNDHTSITAIADPYGARFVYGAAVPEAGSTAFLLFMVAGGLHLLRRNWTGAER